MIDTAKVTLYIRQRPSFASNAYHSTAQVMAEIEQRFKESDFAIEVGEVILPDGTNMLYTDCD